jgi:hypothetical protein
MHALWWVGGSVVGGWVVGGVLGGWVNLSYPLLDVG